MTIIRRFISLARADAHGLLDSLEDRSLVLKQCLRDAELELARKHLHCEELTHTQERLVRQLERLQARSAALDGDTGLAMERQQEELARFSIRRLLAVRKQRELLEERARDTREELAKLKETIREQEQEFQALRDRVQDELAREREKAPSGSPRAGEGCRDEAGPWTVRDEEVELEFLRRRDQGAEDRA